MCRDFLLFSVWAQCAEVDLMVFCDAGVIGIRLTQLQFLKHTINAGGWKLSNYE